MKKILRLLLYGITVILFLTLLFDQVIMPVYTRHGDEFVLPDVTMTDKESAIRKLENSHLIPVIKDSIFDENVERGKVILQNPLPFSKVKKNRKIYLTVSRGSQIKSMPDFRGLTIREVRFQLQELLLEEGNIRYKETANYPEGVVFEQDPQPGESFSPGSSINFTVSLGVGSKNKRIPDLVGLNLVEARKKLKELQILNIKVESERDSTLLPGTVIRQSPRKGTPVLEVKEVTITVSK